jgi:hypothetical protein
VSHREVRFEGLSEREILSLPQQEVENLILLGEPLVFRAGSAIILGSFKIARDRLVIELAQIEGGGEGVLVSLASLAKRYAKLRDLSGVEWIVPYLAPNPILSCGGSLNIEDSLSRK